MKQILLCAFFAVLSAAGVLWLQSDIKEKPGLVGPQAGVVIEYYVVPSHSPWNIAYSLSHDGRLSFQRFHPNTKKVAESQIVQISSNEILAFLQGSIIESGLLLCDQSCIEDKVKTSLSRKRLPRASDASTTVLSIDLSWIDSLLLETENRIQIFRFHSLGTLARLCPDVEELEAILEVGEKLQELRQDVEEHP
ncbi:MAG: hypothetical protein AAF481_11215 [Acidobacteriota bacterium]